MIAQSVDGATLDFVKERGLLILVMSRRPANKLSGELVARLLALLKSPQYQPLNKADLARQLDVPVHERAKLRRRLIDLETEGKIVRIRKNRYVIPKDADLITGTLQVNPQGFGFVENESGDNLGDVFISAENMETGMHRDRVVARIIPEPAPARGGRQQHARRAGRVIRVIERRNSTIVGTVQRSKNFLYVVPDEPALVHDIYFQPQRVPDRRSGATRAPDVNDKVVLRLEPWANRHVSPEGTLIEILGPARDPRVVVLAIVRKHDLATDFPEAVLEQAANLSAAIAPRELAGRTDLRSLPVFTIDPEDARDFDDAIHVQTFDHSWEIGIHIADVAHYVKPGSALDREAYVRGNSVYLPDRVLPMLPERLSNGICSLRPGEDRLTKSVFVRFDKEGRLVGHRFAESVIRSRYRLTYQEAFERLQGGTNETVDKLLRQAWRIASQLRKRRFAAGALDLDVPEVRILVNSHGAATGVQREVNDISHQLIEEFMLLANEVVAREIRSRAVPAVYRIHEPPDPQKLADFKEVVRSYGINVGDLSDRRAVQRLLDKIEGHPDENILRIGLLRSLRKARYSPEPIGHYGLAKADYVHFTSPIRRYADLIVHRAFGALLPQKKGRLLLPPSTRLEEICEHISLTERVASDAEREAIRQKKLEYLQSCLRKSPRFHATVIEVRNYGLRVEVQEVLLIGLVHVSSLDHDFYLFDASRGRLVGRRTKQSFSVGDQLEVRVVRVDFFKQQADFEVVSKLGKA